MRARRRELARRLLARLEPVIGPRLQEGNRILLLRDSPAFLASLLADIDSAREVVHLETYIFADDRAGRAVADALLRAAGRGVLVRVLIDSYGGGDPARRLLARLAPSGAAVRIYRPHAWWRPQRQALRRLHRKLAWIDRRVAYVGGINIDDDPARDAATGEAIGPRLDMAVRCEGAIVGSVSYAMRRLWWAVSVARMKEVPEPPPPWEPVAPCPAPGARAMLLLRDNLRHRHSIERAYLSAIAGARARIVLANAYFLPGRRLRAALVEAARRGVLVTLLLQGRVEYTLQHRAQRALYGQLLAAGIAIHEYRASFLHAKVAVVDGSWATVGSSNIDPLSLLLAREANVVVQDAAFAAEVERVLDTAIREGAMHLPPEVYGRRSWMRRVGDWLAYGLLRAATVVLASGRDY
jgi:cardiolipin synthase